MANFNADRSSFCLRLSSSLFSDSRRRLLYQPWASIIAWYRLPIETMRVRINIRNILKFIRKSLNVSEVLLDMANHDCWPIAGNPITFEPHEAWKYPVEKRHPNEQGMAKSSVEEGRRARIAASLKRLHSLIEDSPHARDAVAV